MNRKTYGWAGMHPEEKRGALEGAGMVLLLAAVLGAIGLWIESPLLRYVALALAGFDLLFFCFFYFFYRAGEE